MPGYTEFDQGFAHYGGLSVGKGAVADIYGIKTGQVSVNPPSIATVSRAAVAVTITGVKVGDKVVFEPPATLNDDLLFVGARVTGDDTVTIYIYNPTAGPIDDGALNWDYVWFDFTA